MSSSRALTFIVLAASMAAGAHAQTGLTREQVKAELAEAIRTGDIIGSGESGLTLRELNPQRYANVQPMGPAPMQAATPGGTQAH